MKRPRLIAFTISVCGTILVVLPHIQNRVDFIVSVVGINLVLLGIFIALDSLAGSK